MGRGRPGGARRPMCESAQCWLSWSKGEEAQAEQAGGCCRKTHSKGLHFKRICLSSSVSFILVFACTHGRQRPMQQQQEAAACTGQRDSEAASEARPAWTEAGVLLKNPDCQFEVWSGPRSSPRPGQRPGQERRCTACVCDMRREGKHALQPRRDAPHLLLPSFLLAGIVTT